VEDPIRDVRENGTAIQAPNGSVITVRGDTVLIDDVTTGSGAIYAPDAKVSTTVNTWLDQKK